MRVLVVSKSLCGYVLNQVQYNMESAQIANNSSSMMANHGLKNIITICSM